MKTPLQIRSFTRNDAFILRQIPSQCKEKPKHREGWVRPFFMAALAAPEFKLLLV
jgi:hypothetical protein